MQSTGSHGQESGKGGAKEEVKGTGKMWRVGSSPSDKWSLGPPCQGKGGQETIFQASSTQCSALSDFSTLLDHFGSFWSHLEALGPKSAKL